MKYTIKSVKKKGCTPHVIGECEELRDALGVARHELANNSATKVIIEVENG